MDPIREGMTGSMVEDVQDRLASLDYEIDETERSASEFGSSTANAVARFRIEHGLSISAEVDLPCWSVLVDECYQMGDRTLYLRLPNFHGNDVRCLQNALNVLGFSCGEADGYYGPHTEGAVKLFQENVGMLADGIAFADTFDAIERLRHVWAGKPAQGPHPMSGMGFARAALVLDEAAVALTAEDPISRNVAGRIWNIARAMSDDTGLCLVDSTEDALPTDRAVIVLAVTPRPAVSSVANVTMADDGDLALRLRTALESSRTKPPVVRIELPADPNFDGSFTINDAQMLAVSLVDTLCAALS
ncbi:MAG: peptidoglycan-binding domain-containing protein [Parolsenella sp.]|uniref:peptidoglycan-binding domain-containing protein n=1 Tax=Parolsenella sp. TaxID=2083006 RepID=UPI002A758062|nr:peptidoglycan-binding domain-containing protein [Parolsenella sp.]MDY3291728.1 peptidoglycan-binding domain-containing protein [Parolsenella sp.]